MQLKQNKGFTLLEVLISLFLISMIVVLFPIILKFFQKVKIPENSFDIDIFILDFYSELNVTEEYDINIISEREIQIKNDKRIVSYRYFDGRLIKSVNNNGFITLMYDVSSFNLEETKDNYKLRIGGQNTIELITTKK
ncbi:competence type IV pilus minor pilin ComGF [Phocicoccus pinnipedialis]|uniref:Prepilin-type N-terminal cleavage/methylation domain-containing protein n=1 Tax=Phocicoccus pinnipedialis TaxID=110845 RepID=A0A6V7REU3_9BACL|nr:competence type IV pilus minor pilin ComGF [Jeotgalicoccus pinnipedialis]MBP1939305.1 prepilin-type N-terminal cleavage/methylation domain-containing protein [Jeotgalicoccus pinnipedialis]CAD2075953.1 hypothetical protein JEOPIN946_01134 [Jeotgalicoccus pinnipedialis]